MTFPVFKVADMPLRLYQQMRSLNLRKRGFSRGHMRDCRKAKHEHSVAILAMAGKRLLGWALLVQCLAEDGSLKEYSTNFYVRKNARKRGVGHDLFWQVVAFLTMSNQKAHVCIWSPDSERFYRANQSPLVRVIVSPKYSLSTP
jgi:hypothetical protein